MATTDATIAIEPAGVVNALQYQGQKIVEVVGVTAPVSYTTGGFAVPSTTANAQPRIGTVEQVLGIEVFLAANLASVRIGVWNPITKKILLFVPNTGSEVANGTDVSTYTARAQVIGF